MIREKDGIHLELDRHVVADSRSSRGDINVMTHAHFDHLHTGGEVICSEVTGELAAARSGKDIPYHGGGSEVKLLPSGHIIGSTAALLEGERSILYTGDVSPRDRLYLNGFSPVEADELVIESTYGIPAYRFPPQEEVESRIRDWIQDNQGPFMLAGYSLGKAQKIQKIVEDLGNQIYVHEKVAEMNRAVERVAGIEFRAEEFTGELEENDVLVAPSSALKSGEIRELAERKDALKAGFSGWASDDSYSYRGGYDETFVLSDHADFDELVEIVEEVDPEKVYTHHGFDEAFASYLKKELGFNARSLKKNQSSLTDF